VWGTTATIDEFTGDFGSALEDRSIGACRLVALFSEKSLQAIFGVLQHYRGGERTLRGRHPRSEFDLNPTSSAQPKQLFHPFI
jgi:hypothetical protein